MTPELETIASVHVPNNIRSRRRLCTFDSMNWPCHTALFVQALRSAEVKLADTAAEMPGPGYDAQTRYVVREPW